MTLRTARYGANRGGQFWGCLDYPSCKGTRDAGISANESNKDEQATAERAPNLNTLNNWPRPLIVASSTLDRRTQFYEGTSVPRSVVPFFNLMTTTNTKRAISQWAAEWPRNFIPNSIREIPAWLAVLGKVIRRGSVLPLPLTIESEFSRLFGKSEAVSESEWVTGVAKIYETPYESKIDPATFDSDEEVYFYDTLLPRLFSKDLRWLWQRQVSIGSLTGHKEHLDANTRVDFVFSCPGKATFVVEIDGEQHLLQQEQDQRRDSVLRDSGIEVIRISTAELRTGNGINIGRLAALIQDFKVNIEPELNNASKWLLAGRRVQQIQLVLLEALEKGFFDWTNHESFKIFVQTDPHLGIRNSELINHLSIKDLNELVEDIALCHGVLHVPRFELTKEPNAFLSLQISNDIQLEGTVVNICSSYLPASPEIETPKSTPFNVENTDTSSYKKLLHRVYGYAEFREGQLEAVERTLNGKDSIILLPTGSGKSIAFQLASLLRPGVAIVVDPILSLIDDQLENLRFHGIDRAQKIAGNQTTWEREKVMQQLGRAQFSFCYVAPERFQSSPFRDSLRALTTNTPVSLIVVDEVHCVSEWGHDFRPAYLNLARIAREYCSSGDLVPPIMGLTGTASRTVLKDVQRELEINDYESVVVPKSFNRPELSYEAITCRSAEKNIRLKSLLDRLPSSFGLHRSEFYFPTGASTHAGLLFCPHVNGDHGVVEVGRVASNEIGNIVPTYASTPPKGSSKELWTPRLKEMAEGFKRNKFSLMTCTKAFGMGIDKPNVRYTIHYNLPSSIEAFYQEAGRAGRDGRAAKCFILFSDDFPARTQKILNPAESSMQDVQAGVTEAGWDKADDITRALFFHGNSFKGANADNLVLNQVIEELGSLEKPNRVRLAFEPSKRNSKKIESSDEVRKLRERALHRLVVTGAVADYTIDFSGQEFNVVVSGISKKEIIDNLYKYISGYQRQRAAKSVQDITEYLQISYNEFVSKVGDQIIQFVYEVVERGRRQALSEMLRICKRATNSDSIRQDILNYLDRSKFTDQIEEILESDNAGIDKVELILEEIRSFTEAEELRSECARELESYPDQPSLRLLLGISEAMTRKPDNLLISQNIEAAMRDGQLKYGLSQETLIFSIINSCEIIADSKVELAQLVLQSALKGASSPLDGARQMLKNLRTFLLSPAIELLVKNLTASVAKINRK
jgi:ATP-dependent DNA helicase RecQ